MHHIPVLHDVVFAFQPKSAFGAGVGFGAGFEQLVPADGFGADEVLFEIRVDRAGSFHGAGVDGDRPGAAFVFADGEERDQAEQAVGVTDEPDQAALGEPVAGEEFGGVGVGHLREFSFDFRADRGSPGIGA